MQPSINVEDTLEKIIEKDQRYHRDAYYFVRDALDVAQKKFCENRAEPQHVTGQQLLGGIRDHALEEFGPMALMVLDEWGVTKCADFGEIVFNMVEASLLGKTDNDSREDFADGYDFEEAFRQPYLPKKRKTSSKRKSKAPAPSKQPKE